MEIERIVRSRVKKLCVFCGSCRNSGGIRYFELKDLCVLANDATFLDAAKATTDCEEFMINVRKYTVDSLGLAIRDSILLLHSKEEATEAELLLAPRKKGIRGGIVTCWANCNCSLVAALVTQGRAHKVESDSVIKDEPFDLGYMIYDSAKYDQFLQKKVDEVRCKIGQHFADEVLSKDIEMEIFASPPKYFREKCRFAVRHHQSDNRIDLLLWENGGVPTHAVECFPIASRMINLLISPLRREISSRSVLKTDLSAIHFLSTLKQNCIIRLLYNDREFSDDDITNWRDEAIQLREILQAYYREEVGIDGIEIHITLRGKSLKVNCMENTIIEEFKISSENVNHERVPEVVSNGHVVLKYLQSSEGFSNPNGTVNQICLNWICNMMKTIHQDLNRNHQASVHLSDSNECVSSSDKFVSSEEKPAFDLLELYCGMGNHTIAIARSGFVRHVLGVEINEALCITGRENISRNQLDNVEIILSDSAKFCNRVLRQRKYTSSRTPTTPSTTDATAQAMTLESQSNSTVEYKPRREYLFDAVLVDPPRCGLDSLTLELVQSYPYIVYISCSVDSLMRDLSTLLHSHELVKYAIFDQFAYTDHLESGVYLRKK